MKENNNLVVFNELLSNLKRYSFELKFLLDGLFSKNYSENEQELLEMISHCSANICICSKDFGTLQKCILNNEEMNQKTN